MKLFNKRCWMGHNGVVGITLKILLLLFASKVTYAQLDWLNDSDDPGIKRKYVVKKLSDVGSICNSQADGAQFSIPSSNATRGDLYSGKFLAKTANQEVWRELDLDRLKASDINALAWDITDTFFCWRSDGRMYFNAR